MPSELLYSEQGHPQLHRVLRDPSASPWLPAGMGHHHLSGQPVPLPHHPYHKNLSKAFCSQPVLQGRCSIPQITLWASCGGTPTDPRLSCTEDSTSGHSTPRAGPCSQLGAVEAKLSHATACTVTLQLSLSFEQKAACCQQRLPKQLRLFIVLMKFPMCCCRGLGSAPAEGCCSQKHPQPHLPRTPPQVSASHLGSCKTSESPQKEEAWGKTHPE